jgi:hypothetical protein
MMTRSSLCASFLAWGVFLILGSSNTQFHSSPGEAPTASLPQVHPAPSNIHLDAVAILDAACRVVDVDWLFTRVQQRRLHGDMPWSSEATLQIGPKGCRRLDSETRFGSSSTRRTLVICDGQILARVTPIAGGSPKVESWKAPAEAQVAFFERFGCGGPGGLLAVARARGHEWIAEPATANDRPAVAITGKLIAPQAATGAKADLLTDTRMRLFLDGETLQLVRAEWWTDAPTHGGVLVFEVEFPDLRVNQPLSTDDCQRAFSYSPSRPSE